MKQFILGAVSTVIALLLAAATLLWSVGSPGSGAPVEVSTPSAGPTSSEDAPSEGETRLGEVRLTSSDIETSDGALREVTAIGSGVALTPDGLRAARLDIDATLPFDAAATQIGDTVRLGAAGGGLASLTRRVTVFDRDIEVRATGAVRADDGQLLIEPETIDLDGPDWLDSAASSIARRLVTIRHTVQGVPKGMALTSVSVQDTGFRVHLRGSDVVISQ